LLSQVKNIWESISSFGERAENSFETNVKIRNLNQSCFIAQTGFLAAIAQHVFLKQFPLAFLSSFTVIVLFVIYFLNNQGLHKASLYIFIFFLSIVIFIGNNFLGNEAGAFLFHFTILHCIALLFYSPHEKSELAVVVGFNVLLLGIAFLFPGFHLFDSKPNESATDLNFKINLAFNVIFNIYLIFMILENKKGWSVNLQSSLNTEQDTNKALQKLVKDKDILLAELHHRVKNNLALINGLLTLQSRDTNNEEALMVISESKNRIRSMALLHDKLYLKNSYDDVNLSEYIKEIVDHINVSLIEADNMEIRMQFDDVLVDISKGISIGLIVNEIITNSLKHAFTKQNKIDVIEVILKKGVKNHLKIVDNGKGIDEMVKRKNATSMGINIIGSLVDQIDGTYSINTDKGTYFDLYF
jgi:two-component sensor histidine kinase